MKRYFIFLSICLYFWCAKNASAFDINGEVWLISGITTNIILKEKLQVAEHLARRKEFLSAENQLSNILEEYFLDNFIYEGEPFNLTVAGAKLWYKSLASAHKDASVIKDADKLLKQFEKEAKDLAWPSYKYLFHRKRDYYFIKKDYENVLKTQKDLILYDVFDSWAIDSYLEYLKTFSLDDNTASFFSEIKKRGGKINSKMEIALLEISFKNKIDNVWEQLFEWFENNRQKDFETIKQGLSLAAANLKSDDIETAKIYYIVLTDLALGQIAIEENLPNIAYILNERQKLKTLIPECAE